MYNLEKFIDSGGGVFEVVVEVVNELDLLVDFTTVNFPCKSFPTRKMNKWYNKRFTEECRHKLNELIHTPLNIEGRRINFYYNILLSVYDALVDCPDHVVVVGTAGLDLEGIQKLKSILEEYSKGNKFILVSTASSSETNK